MDFEFCPRCGELVDTMTEIDQRAGRCSHGCVGVSFCRECSWAERRFKVRGGRR